MNTLNEIRKKTAHILCAYGIEEAELEATILVERHSGRKRHEFAFSSAHCLDNVGLEHDLDRRRRREPLAYIEGKSWFYGLELKVSPTVLIPRPETELIVEAALNAMKDIEAPLVLDLGTGSGAIAIAIAANNSRVKILATDISTDAVNTAAENIIRYGLQERITLVVSDLFYSLGRVEFDIIVSNPPYIPVSELDGLAAEIKYEPQAALAGGLDGLEYYRAIFAGARNYLKQSAGKLMLEAGCGQAVDIAKIAMSQGMWSLDSVLSDYGGIERIVICSRHN